MTGPGRTVCLGEWGGVFPHPSQSFRRKLHETFVSFVERTCVCVCVCPVYILSNYQMDAIMNQNK